MREKWDSREREGKRVEDMGENKEGERERGEKEGGRERGKQGGWKIWGRTKRVKG
jgi:hypothetical protein